MVIVVKNYRELNYNQIKILKIKTTMFDKHDLIQNKEFYPMIGIQIRDLLMDSLSYKFQ
jgi:hypothetical protein